MSRYSVATTKDNLSSLIDKALAGEEVIITRHGKPVVEINVVKRATPVDVKTATTRLQARLSSQSALAIPSANFREWLYQDYKY